MMKHKKKDSIMAKTRHMSINEEEKKNCIFIERKQDWQMIEKKMC